MRVVIASQNPVKIEAVKRGFSLLFKDIAFHFESVKANSGVADQPMSNDEMRTGAIGRIIHARELSPDADFYVALEGGVEEMFGDLYNYAWVIIESKKGKRGCGRTPALALPPGIRDIMLREGLEQSHATDRFFSKSGTRVGTGTIGPLTNDAYTYIDWYMPGVVCALVPFVKEDLYPV